MPALTPDLPRTEIAIIEMTNEFRHESRIAEVMPNATLAAAARAYAEFLAKSTLFSHEADGRRPADRAKAAGYAYCEIAENLALFQDSRGFETQELALQMIEGWKNSTAHRKAMLSPYVTEIGVAVVKVRGADKYLGVQLFGRPESLQYRFDVDNRTDRVIGYTFGSERLEVKPQYTVRHTACTPGEISFELARGNGFVHPATARYKAIDGQVYRLTTGPDAKIRVEISMGRPD